MLPAVKTLKCITTVHLWTCENMTLLTAEQRAAVQVCKSRWTRASGSSLRQRKGDERLCIPQSRSELFGVRTRRCIVLSTIIVESEWRWNFILALTGKLQHRHSNRDNVHQIRRASVANTGCRLQPVYALRWHPPTITRIQHQARMTLRTSAIDGSRGSQVRLIRIVKSPRIGRWRRPLQRRRPHRPCCRSQRRRRPDVPRSRPRSTRL